MGKDELPEKEIKNMMQGSLLSPIYTAGGEEISHYLGLKLLGAEPAISLEYGNNFLETGLRVTDNGASGLTELSESLIAAAGPFSVLGISALSAYYSKRTENEKSKKILEGMSITSALSSALYALGDYLSITQGDFETMTSSLPYEASVPMALGGAAAVIGYSRIDDIKDYIKKGTGFLEERDQYLEEVYEDEQRGFLETEPLEENDYEKIIDEIEKLKNCDPENEAWDRHLKELEEYDINSDFIEDAALAYIELEEKEEN